MKTAFEELESPYLDGDLEFVVPVYEWGHSLSHEIGESPFVNFVVSVPETETSQPAEGLETISIRPDEEDEGVDQEFFSVEADLRDETEQDWIDEESDEYDLQDSESVEAEQSIHEDEADALDEVYGLADEAMLDRVHFESEISDFELTENAAAKMDWNIAPPMRFDY